MARGILGREFLGERPETAGQELCVRCRSRRFSPLDPSRGQSREGRPQTVPPRAHEPADVGRPEARSSRSAHPGRSQLGRVRAHVKCTDDA
jgi:hypothetical protein